MSLKKIKEYTDPHIGEIVLGGIYTSEMLLDVVDYVGDDYFYVMLVPFKGLVLKSCLLDFIPLKGSISAEQYEKIENSFDLNIKYWICSDINNHLSNVEFLVSRYVDHFKPLKNVSLWKNLAEGIILSDLSIEKKRIELVKVMPFIKKFGITDVLEKLN
jgi:hypothetical protein